MPEASDDMDRPPRVNRLSRSPRFRHFDAVGADVMNDFAEDWRLMMKAQMHLRECRYCASLTADPNRFCGDCRREMDEEAARKEALYEQWLKDRP